MRLPHLIKSLSSRLPNKLERINLMADDVPGIPGKTVTAIYFRLKPDAEISRGAKVAILKDVLAYQNRTGFAVELDRRKRDVLIVGACHSVAEVTKLLSHAGFSKFMELERVKPPNEPPHHGEDSTIAKNRAYLRSLRRLPKPHDRQFFMR